ncbi:palmitoleoyl-protein carboxylesterase NOTUM-like [Macrobrachium nipponense]|uniref:palmitoleoyl-protein carboxylesterase NOTUM-like n=1 Tax=Macrobrachium nipponense TaxID=159736 RepID=UPI0030C824C6
MDGLCWRLLLALILGGSSGGRGGPGSAGGGGIGGGGGSSGLSAALGALGPLGSGPLGAVVGPRLMARLVEGEAVRRVVEAVETPMTRYYFDPATRAVCNDNSPAGFYFRRSKNDSPRWIVFLEGGWYCFDRKSCEQRWHGLKPLMTSRGWPPTRQVGGILSPDPKVNPHWWEANHVFVPYCSSDSWSGTRYSAESAGGFSFMGSVIIENVIQAVVRLNLTHGHKLILAGSSAGGVGAMVNVDRVSQQLLDQGIEAEVRAVSDSGWFLDNEPFAPLECLNAHSCPPVEAIRRGQKLWQGRIPTSCLQEYPQHPWYCYFGYRAYPTMKSPLFVFQWVFDEAQMTADNVGKPISKEQWDYIHGIGERLRKTFENVTALFAPSCISHTVLTKKDWTNIKIGDVSLPQALNCWDAASTTTLNALFHQRENRTSGLSQTSSSSSSTTSKHNKVRHHNGGSSSSSSSRNRQRQHRQKRRREKGQGGAGRKARPRDSSAEEHRSQRHQNGRVRSRVGGKTPRRKDQTSAGGVGVGGESFNVNLRSDRVQSSHLDLVRGAADSSDSRNDSAGGRVREGALVITANITVIDPGSTRAKLAQTLDSANYHPQGLSGPNVPHGDMLADSPRESAGVPSKNYNKIESNAIETPQVDIQKGDTIDTPKTGDGGDNKEEEEEEGGEDRSTRRRNRKKKKRKKKKREEKKRKKKRRERRKKQKERRRKQKEKRNKKRTRLKGSLEMGEDAMVPKLNDAYSADLCPAHTLHLTDNCAWPHCNYACPKLLNPFTGEEMNFLDLLKSFGLDMASIANALGIDIHTLNSMGNDELLLILTQ